jgi:hypothetical protein
MTAKMAGGGCDWPEASLREVAPPPGRSADESAARNTYMLIPRGCLVLDVHLGRLSGFDLHEQLIQYVSAAV